MKQIHSALAAWMSEKAGCYPWLKLCFPQVADCGDYTWVAPVQHGSLENHAAVSRYYRRAGQLLGIAYLVNLTDLHHENIIATATQPVPVDLEVIMSVLPRVPEDQPDASNTTLRQTTSSPTSTGLIPLGTSFKELGGDISGLAANGLRARHRALDRQGRSDMRYIHTIAEITPVNHLPTLENNPVLAANYVDEIVEGFVLTLQIAMKHRNDLETFICNNASNLHVRVLARMSNDYATVLAGLSRVGHNTNPEQLFSILRRNSVGLAESMVDSKEEQLRTWAIPHFWAIASETTIRDPWGRPTGRLYVAPIAQTTAKIRAITETDINRHISLIRMAFHKPEEVILPLGPRLATQDAGSFEEFEQIHFDALQAQTVTGADGSVNWPVLAVVEREQLAVQPLLGGLYRGIAGVAELFTTIPHRDAQCHQLATSLLRAATGNRHHGKRLRRFVKLLPWPGRPARSCSPAQPGVRNFRPVAAASLRPLPHNS